MKENLRAGVLLRLAQLRKNKTMLFSKSRKSTDARKSGMSVETYVQHFKAGTTPSDSVSGLAARIIRGTEPEDFLTFTDDAERKLVMFMGPDGLESMLGKDGYDMLVTIGYEPDYLRHKVEQGNEFKLVVLEEGTAKLATWDNTLDIVGEVYPDIAQLLERHRDALKNTSFEEIEKAAGYQFLDVEKIGKVDSRFMTHERLRESAGSLADVRAFLYFTVHLRELYRGDGFTDENGSRGPMEYIAPNIAIADSGKHAVVDLDIQLPISTPAILKGTSLMTSVDKLGLNDPNLIREFYSPNLALARAEGRKLGLNPAKKQIDAGERGLLILIDEEWDFTEKGRLPVPGMFGDVERLISRIKQGVLQEKYTDVIVTIDVHPPHTIHSDSWWVDDKGNAPDVTLPVRMELVDPTGAYPFLGHFVDGSTKPFKPRIMKSYTINQYAPHLQKSGQGEIWVFADHCREGTDGVAIVPALAETLEWLSAARDIQPLYMYKGMIPQTDWFGPFRPCMDITGHPQGGLQTTYLDFIRKAKWTEIAGEADDFCVKAGNMQVLDYYGNDRPVLESISFITDCTSAIFPDDPAAGNTPNADFRKEMASKGVNMILHDTPFH
jgi:nicotinamidase-related amidase